MKSVLLSRYLMLLAAVILIAGTGCKKIKRTENSTTVKETPQGDPVLVAGKGGMAGFKITPIHDGLNIDSCLMYIKYNSSVVPFNERYDDSVWAVREDGKPVATFLNLKPGNYYIFGRGWDLIRSEKVEGGLPFIIPQEQDRTIHSLVLPIYDYE